MVAARDAARFETRWPHWAIAILAASLLMTASSWIEAPMYPVPMTMQTLATLLIGGVLGARMGAIALIAWLILGIAGLPLFSGGGGGPGHFFGPTGGYLVAFVLMAWLAGLYADRRSPPTLIGAFAVGVGAHLLCLGLGAAWLATHIGISAAISAGVTPFLLGAVVKSALAAGAFVFGQRFLSVFSHRRP